ncbi:MAG: hypothetical protein KOO62_13485 [candidate division Zixibacteria bacterium]|nr:hypothetical protein [candidate division Zixibacteria bacterium]
MKIVKALSIAVTTAILTAGSVLGVTVAEIRDLSFDDLESVGFTLKKGAEINIDALGIRVPLSRDLVAYAWIIDSDSRELVWEMRSSRTDRYRGSKVLRGQEDVEFLDAGSYELYFSVKNKTGWSGRKKVGFFDMLGIIFDGDYDDEISRRDVGECYVELTSDELSASDIDEFRPDGGFPDALVRHNQLGDSEYLTTGFSLSKSMNLRIYALIEFPESNKTPVDYAWIIDADTHKKVWQIDRWDLEHAGGGDKNQLYDDEVMLEKGTYVLHMVSDDSHSWEEFNVNPPYDPLNWGLTVLPGKNFDKSAFEIVEIPGRGEPLIEFTRVRDNRYYEQSFKLSQVTDLQVYAIGEMDHGGRDFVDYGTIMEAGTGQVAWEMTHRNTEHAGGAPKNMMFDGVITLEPGTYTAYYVTDGSHSSRRWNASAPFDADAYGLSIYAEGKGTPKGFELVDEKDLWEGTDILARITRVGDNEHRRARFELKEDTQVQIYALGEGSSGRMYDYAYIVDLDSGRDIWEMTWRRTDHAGGADKNRLFDDEILLRKGEYEVVYVSDDSHSFGDWNSSPPRDAVNWGVTLSLAD